MATDFKKMVTLSNQVLLIVDALNLAFRWKHMGAKDFVEDYIAVVKSLQKSYKAGTVVIACDKGSSSYRKALHPGYKQGRKDKQALQTPEEEQAFFDFLDEFNRAIEEISKIFTVFRFDGVEADDISSYIVTQYADDFDQVWLISSDRDWDLLVTPKVSRFSYVTRKEITYDNWSEHYEYPCEDHISIKCLTGDTGDSIPGVPGIGPKTAQKLVCQYGSTYDIIANLPITGKYKYIANLNTFGADALMLNYRLMDLVSYCDEALGEENCESIRIKMDEVLSRSK